MKYTFITKPVVHLISSTQPEFSENLFRDMRRRGADLSNGMCWFFEALPEEDPLSYSQPSERLCEFAGKLCYNAFGKNGSTKSTTDYLNDNVYKAGHLSIAYHAHFTFYISGISRRLSHEFLRHYIGVGCSEGSPSQMSTRYVTHPPRFVVHPRYCDNAIEDTESANSESVDLLNEYIAFKKSCKRSYQQYLKIVKQADNLRGLPKKRVLEAASSALPQATETSLVWTCNPISLRKMIIERSGDTADLEFRRLVIVMQKIMEERFKSFKFR